MDSKSKILLVDDEPRFIDSLQTILLNYNYDCQKAYSGREALEKLASDQYHLALLDVNLPDINGCDIAQFIKENCPATTAIMLTGTNTVETAITSMKLGAYDFLSKPLDINVLLKTLENGLRHNKLKQDLRHSEEKFKVLAEAAREGIVIHSANKILETNEPFWEMFGYSRVDDHNLQISDVFETEILQFLETAPLCDKKGYSVTCKRKDGTPIHLEVKICTITYKGQSSHVWVLRDVTHRLLAENEKLEMQKKLAASEKLQALGLMAGSVAHDLNNILVGLVTMPDVLLHQMDKSNPHYEEIEQISAAGKRAAAVVSDLVAIARGQKQHKSARNINEIIVEYLTSLEHSSRHAKYPDIEVKIELEENLHAVSCTPQHIHKLLLNLIGNSLEALGNKGSIHISTKNCTFTPPHGYMENPEGNEYVQLTISDNGPGIPEKYLDNIFDPFFSTKNMVKSGTGLGLSIVWNIVQEHNGWIEAKNKNPGASFEIYFPMTTDTNLVSCIDPKLFTRGNDKNILIVDDKPEQCAIMESILRDMGYAAKYVLSGEAAIEYTRTTPADLILMDFNLGRNLNGYETLKIIHANNPAQKSIVISGFIQKEDIDKAKQLGVSLFLEKPLTLSAINNAIYSVMQGSC